MGVHNKESSAIAGWPPLAVAAQVRGRTDRSHDGQHLCRVSRHRGQERRSGLAQPGGYLGGLFRRVHGEASRPVSDRRPSWTGSPRVTPMRKSRAWRTTSPGCRSTRHSKACDAKIVAKGAKIYERGCAKCHDEGGALPDDDAGILAGQWLDYLQYSMQDLPGRPS